ncbi:MAG: hypothetical protein GXX95_00870 [Methanomassiliicoccus sp.]|nr:hypothetical protein [Methanomassiliicoccus sp.]
MVERSRIRQLSRKLAPLTEDEILHLNVFSNYHPPVTCWKSAEVVTLAECQECHSGACRAIHLRRIDRDGNECLPGASE